MVKHISPSAVRPGSRSSTPALLAVNDDAFLAGGGEMGERIRVFDWSQTSLGPLKDWPQSVRTAVSLMLQSPVPIILLWGPDGYTTYNDAYSVFARGRHPHLLGQTVVDAWPEVAEFNRNVMKQVLAGKTLSYKDQTLTLYRNGRPEAVSMDLNYSPILDENGKPAGVLAIVVETTQRVRAQQSQVQAERRLKTIMSASPVALWTTDASGDINFVNQTWIDWTGRPFEDHLGKGWHRHILPEDRRPELGLSNVLPKRKEYRADFRIKRIDGEIRWVTVHGRPYYDDSGKFAGYGGSCVDITERKRAEEALRQSEAEYKQLVDLSPEAIAVHTNAHLVYVNQAGAALVGAKSPEELIGQPMLKFVHPDYAKGVMQRVRQIFATGKPTELRQEKFLRLNGEPIDVEAISIPFTYMGKPAAQVVVRDITQRKRAEEALRQSEERFRLMAESIPQKIFTAGPSGEIDYFNPEWMEFSGLTLKQLQDGDWAQVVHPDDVAENIRRWQRSLDTGRPFQFEHRFRRHDGTYHWHLTRAHAMRGPDGKITKWLGSSTDIEDLRKRRELEKRTALLTEQREQLMEINRTKDEFISLASHQLRTPATAVKQYVGMVLDGYVGELSAGQQELLTLANLSNERQISIINDLLQVARIDAGNIELKKEPVALLPLIQDVLHDQQACFEERQQTAVVVCKQKNISAEIDAERMRMVFENIIDNASKYSPAGKKITVRLAQAGGKVVIAIKDEGVGMSETDMPKLFHKFSRLDNPLSASVGGTGLGLYWVKKVIDLHGGTITVKSEPGRGSVFTIRLPEQD